MNISDDDKKIILDEIKYVIQKMIKAQSAEEKLYFFSGIYAVTQRTFNISCDSNLIYLHFVLRNVYQSIHARLQAITKGGESLIPLSEEFFKRLIQITKELARKIEKEESLNETLKKYVILSYTTTGNGYYLVQKGSLKI